MRYTCGYCLFALETEDRSSDEIKCFFKEMGYRKINDYPCAKWVQRIKGFNIEDIEIERS